MHLFRVVALALATALCIPASQKSIRRDGNGWVEVETGQIPAGSLRRITIVTQGNVRARGVARSSTISYRIEKRVRAGSQREAERLFHEFVLAVRESTLSVIVPVWVERSPDLSVEVPQAVPELSLATTSGDLEVSGMDGLVFGRTGSGLINADRLGSSAKLTSGGGKIRLGTIAGSVFCSSKGGDIDAKSVGPNSWFETAGGNLTIDQAGGNLQAATTGGNIRIGRCAGQVRLRTGAGGIEVRDAGGLVDAATLGGTIRVRTAQSVRCETGAGSIHLEDVRSGLVNAITEVGNIVAVMNADPAQDCSLRTNAGDVTVSAPSNISVKVHAINMTAGSVQGIVSEFPQVRLQAPERLTLAITATGILNRGGSLLRIYAAGGIIYLRRQK